MYGVITTIGDAAFYYSPLTKLILDSSVATIGKESFFHANKSTSLIIPSSITKIGQDAFHNSEIVSLRFHGDIPPIGKRVLIIDDFTFFKTPISAIEGGFESGTRQYWATKTYSNSFKKPQ